MDVLRCGAQYCPKFATDAKCNRLSDLLDQNSREKRMAIISPQQYNTVHLATPMVDYPSEYLEVVRCRTELCIAT